MWQFAVYIRETKNISKNFIPEMAMRWYSGPNSTAEASKIRKLIMGSWRLPLQILQHAVQGQRQSHPPGTGLGIGAGIDVGSGVGPSVPLPLSPVPIPVPAAGGAKAKPRPPATQMRVKSSKKAAF